MPDLTRLDLTDPGVAVVYAALTEYYKKLTKPVSVRRLTDAIAVCEVLASLCEVCPDRLREALGIAASSDDVGAPTLPTPEEFWDEAKARKDNSEKGGEQ